MELGSTEVQHHHYFEKNRIEDRQMSSHNPRSQWSHPLPQSSFPVIPSSPTVFVLSDPVLSHNPCSQISQDSWKNHDAKDCHFRDAKSHMCDMKGYIASTCGVVKAQRFPGWNLEHRGHPTKLCKTKMGVGKSGQFWWGTDACDRGKIAKKVLKMLQTGSLRHLQLSWSMKNDQHNHQIRMFLYLIRFCTWYKSRRFFMPLLF